MKVVAINGSPRLLGNTSNMLNDVLDEIGKAGIETEMICLFDYQFEQCNNCRSCEMRGDGECILPDDLNELVNKMREADGIILASPSYYGSCTAQMRIFLERAGLSLEFGDMGLRRHIGAAITVCSHDGGTMAYMQMVEWMLRNEMTVVGSRPTPVLRALNSPQYLDDEMGMKALHSLAREMTWAILNRHGLEY